MRPSLQYSMNWVMVSIVSLLVLSENDQHQPWTSFRSSPTAPALSSNRTSRSNFHPSSDARAKASEIGSRSTRAKMSTRVAKARMDTGWRTQSGECDLCTVSA